jgi:acyl-CoA synthetase (AMP-forming)/AMP-acid ligase II
MNAQAPYVHSSPYPPVSIPQAPLDEVVLAKAAGLGDRPALVEAASGRTLSYRELATQVGRFAANLRARGLGRGEVLGVLLPNMPEYAVAFLGTVRAGGVVTTLNPGYTAREVHSQLADAGATRLVTVPAFLETAIAAAAGTRVVELVVVGADAPTLAAAVAGARAAGAPVPALTGFEVLLREPPATATATAAAAQAVAASPRDLVALPYSSGTTGVSKGVMLTHGNLVANLAQIASLVPLRDDDVLMAVLPFFHIYGMEVIMLSGLAQGATLVTLPRFDLEAFLRAHQQYRITHTYVAPPIVVALAKHPMVDRFDLRALRFVLSGAAPLSAEIAAEAGRRIGVEIVQGYGMTELSPVTHFTPQGRNRPGAAGLTVPNTECRIVDPASGASLGPGEDGELWIRGPQVMAGYLNNPAATAATLDADGWLHTGDIAHFDADGYLYIVDRLKELIKYKGFQVPPAELEALLLTHPAVADAAVIGEPDPEAGELPVGFVVLKPGQAATPDELRDFVAAQVAHYKQLRAIRFIDAVPKSSSGKILRRELRKK